MSVLWLISSYGLVVEPNIRNGLITIVYSLINVNLFNTGPWRHCGSTWALRESTQHLSGRRLKIWSSKPSSRKCRVLHLQIVCVCANIYFLLNWSFIFLSSHGRSDPYVNSLVKMHVRSPYSCHELFGFDIMLDENLKPWVLEVNISPRYNTEKTLQLNLTLKRLTIFKKLTKNYTSSI